MKKRFCGILAIVLFVLPLSVTYAEEGSRGRGRSFSIGAGGFFASDFGGGFTVTSADAGSGFFGGGTEIESTRTPYMGGGGFLFLDATFAELSFGFLGGGGTNLSYSFLGMDIGILGKLPVFINDTITVFPLLGITQRFMVSMSDASGNEISNTRDYGSLWFRFGFGMDYSITDNIFFRSQALYGLRRSNRAERNEVDSFAGDPTVNARALQGHGLEIRLALGYRF